MIVLFFCVGLISFFIGEGIGYNRGTKDGFTLGSNAKE